MRKTPPSQEANLQTPHFDRGQPPGASEKGGHCKNNKQHHHIFARMPLVLHRFARSNILLKLSNLAAMAWVLLESDKAALAHALGAVPKCPPPHAFMKPTAKPKPRLPQPIPGSAAAEAGKKRKVVDDLPCVCTCKARRWTDNMTDLDKLLLKR